MGWVILLFLALAVLALLWALRTPRPLGTIVAAALMLGATGYALQGRPALTGDAADVRATQEAFDPRIVELRQQMFGRFQYADSYFAASDALTRAGNLRGAAQVLLGGVRSAPESLPLWTGLGAAIARADGDTLSPAAQIAFRRARTLNPEHPAPWFFQGLALIRAGELEAARPYWARAVAVSREGSPYRAGIAERLAVLDQFIEFQAAMRTQMGPVPRQ